MSESKNPLDSRRKFFKRIGTIGLGAATGSVLTFESCNSEAQESKEKIKLLGQDNKLVEVESSQVQPNKMVLDKEYLHRRGRISHARLAQ